MHTINKTEPLIVSEEFESALNAFLVGAQRMIDKHHEQHTNQFANLEYTVGPKYIRVVSNYMGKNRSVYCFICLEHGKIWKAKGWTSPERKNARSCIFDADAGLSGVDWHGTVYLR